MDPTEIDRMTALREAYEAYEELVALYRRKDQRMSTKTTTDEFVPQPYPYGRRYGNPKS